MTLNDHHSDQRREQFGLPEWPKCIALTVMASISGFLVWSYHNPEWPAFVASLAGGVLIGIMAGGLVRVRLLPSLLTLAALSGLFEGIHQGWQRYGLMGAVLGALVGSVVAVVGILLPVMLAHIVMILRGVDPFAESRMTFDRS